VTGAPIRASFPGPLWPSLEKILTNPSRTGARERDLPQAFGPALDLVRPAYQEQTCEAAAICTAIVHELPGRESAVSKAPAPPLWQLPWAKGSLPRERAILGNRSRALELFCLSSQIGDPLRPCYTHLRARPPSIIAVKPPNLSPNAFSSTENSLSISASLRTRSSGSESEIKSIDQPCTIRLRK